MLKDEELILVKDAQKGNQEAFGKLVNAYNKMLIKHIQLRIENDSVKAEDIAQATWLRVLERIDRYDPNKGSFYNYVVKVFARKEIGLFWEEQKKINISSEQDNEIAEIQPSIEIIDKRMLPDDIMLYKEYLRLQKQAYFRIFQLLFLCGGYPHQQLAFAYSKLIYGSQRASNGIKGSARIEGRIEGDSKSVDRKHGNTDLRNLTNSFLHDYSSLAGLGPREIQELNEYMLPVKTRLNVKVSSLFSLSYVLLEQLQPLHDMDVGCTSISDYYTQKRGADKSIPDWCNKVIKSINAALGIDINTDMSEYINMLSCEDKKRSSNCSQCKLRHVAPCNSEVEH